MCVLANVSSLEPLPPTTIITKSYRYFSILWNMDKIVLVLKVIIIILCSTSPRYRELYANKIFWSNLLGWLWVITQVRLFKIFHFSYTSQTDRRPLVWTISVFCTCFFTSVYTTLSVYDNSNNIMYVLADASSLEPLPPTTIITKSYR